jgi:hypothetical protein
MKQKARVLTLIVVLPSLAGGEQNGRLDLYCDGSLEEWTVPPALAVSVQLTACNSSCCYIVLVRYCY